MKELSEETIQKLINAALEVRKRSYNPYSKFGVGAAVLADNNTIIVGTNVENVSFGLTICAERCALFNAISLGYKNFTTLAVVTEDGSTPCGACRQVIKELCGNIPIIIGKTDTSYRIVEMDELLPQAFHTHVS
jgi:cytidine deaminase